MWGIMFMIPFSVVLLFSIHIGNAILHRSFGGNLTAIGCPGGIVWFWLYFCSWGQRQLASDNNRFSRLETIFNNLCITILPLTRFNLPQIDCVIRLDDKNKWTALADLHRLGWYQIGIFQLIENEAHADKLQRPKSMVRVRGNAARFHSARAWLHRSVNEIKVACAR